MRRPRLVATDLDGTLLRSDSTLSDRSRTALRTARSQGIRVVVATARPARVVQALFTADDIDAALVGNGAGRFDPVSGALRFIDALVPATTRQLMDEIERLLPGVAFGVETGHRFLHEVGYRYRPSLDWARYPVARAELAEQPVLKLLALVPGGDPGGAWEVLRPALGGTVACTWSAGRGATDTSYPAILELAAPGVSKAAALAELCLVWHVEPPEVVAFGDAPNDLSMLDFAGTACAVANAHPEVLARCPQHVPGNDEDGVAQFLETLLA